VSEYTGPLWQWFTVSAYGQCLQSGPCCRGKIN